MSKVDKIYNETIVRLHTISRFPIQSANEHLPASRDHMLASYLLPFALLKRKTTQKVNVSWQSRSGTSVGARDSYLLDVGGLVGLNCDLQHDCLVHWLCSEGINQSLPLHLPTVQKAAAIPYCSGSGATECKSVHDNDVVGHKFTPAPNRGP